MDCSGIETAFGRKPYCRAYYSDKEMNPYHWMLHEATHQLNAEVAQLSLAKWLDEGLADYFGTSRIRDGKLMVGQIDPQTYPVWWIDDLATATNLQACIDNGSVIPLRAIITRPLPRGEGETLWRFQKVRWPSARSSAATFIILPIKYCSVFLVGDIYL